MARTSYPTPISPATTRLGFIGTGVIGGAMVTRLLAAGYAVTIYARNPPKVASLLSAGAILVDSPAAVGRVSDVVFTVLGHPSDVKEVVLDGPENVMSSINPNTVLVDHTTNQPNLTKKISDSAKAKNCWSVDAPVSGADVGAREGTLAIFAGGDEEVVNWLKPLFDVLGRVTYMGGPGMGQICKLGNQMPGVANLVGLSESLVFAEKAGLDQRKFLEAVRGGAGGSKIMELFGERMIERDFRPGAFAEYLLKDLRMALDVGVEEDGGDVVVLPGTALASQLYSAMVANGDGKKSIHGVITVIERINGK